ncbi:hypothetical protein SteCoe_39021 [Stentor coeruleus]|uniref:non-specific serine/threonine protein kinase n=1 Tax=Stentor coeruleus TaxID=5963 RepID=A0A1R2AL44_9CILI|nr:hypothetical protein SteCoe_39021 [Stentor coeruleus]
MGVCVSGKFKKSPQRCNLISKSLISDAIILKSKNYSDIHNDFEFLQVIGYGKFGTVREAKRKSSGKRYAIKSIQKEVLNNNHIVLRRELEILSRIDHPNIIRLFESYEDEKYMHLVMELCTGGDLRDRIIDKGSFTESEAATILKKILGAVNYLHLNSISHRDIKPDNFLYESKTSQEIKLVDFGMSTCFSKLAHMKSLAGSPGYLAPEVLKGSYNQSCDVWSLGVLLYYMLSSKLPFEGYTLHDIVSKSVKGAFRFADPEWDLITKEAKDLISKMLVVHPGNRITIDKALSHKWFQIHSENQKSNIPLHILNSLKQSKAHSKLWQEALKVIVRNLNSLQIQELKNAFTLIDKEKTGFITVKSLEEAMSLSGFNIAREEIEKIMENVSYIHEGKINYTEFLLATLDKKKLFNEEIMWEAFCFFDRDRDGFINFEDFETSFKKCGSTFKEEELKEIIVEFQINENDKMDFEVFKEKIIAMNDSSTGEEFDMKTGENIIKTIANNFETMAERNKSRPQIIIN